MPREKSQPVQQRLSVDPRDVTYQRVAIPSKGAVKQYADSERASPRGNWYIFLKHKPNLKSSVRAFKNTSERNDPILGSEGK